MQVPQLELRYILQPNLIPNKIMTNYKAVVTLQGGGHKIVRGAQDMVAHLNYAVQQAKKSIFRSEEYVYGIAVALIASVKFINEYTGQVYLEI
jgi:hypothetical protein